MAGSEGIAGLRPRSLDGQEWGGWTEAFKSAAIVGSSFAFAALAARYAPSPIRRAVWGGIAGAIPLVVSDVSKLISYRNNPFQQKKLVQEFVCHLGELAGGTLIGALTGGSNLPAGFIANTVFSGLAEYTRLSWITALPEEKKFENAMWSMVLNLGLSVLLHGAGGRVAEFITWRQEHLKYRALRLPQEALARNMVAIPQAQNTYKYLDAQGPKLQTVYDWLYLADQSYKKGKYLRTAIIFDELTLRLERAGHDHIALKTRRYFHEYGDRWLNTKYFDFQDAHTADFIYLFTRKRCDPQRMQRELRIASDDYTVGGLFYDSFSEGRLPLQIVVASTNGRVEMYLHRHSDTGHLIANLHNIEVNATAPRGSGQRFVRNLGEVLEREFGVDEMLLTSISQTGRYVWPKMGVRPVSAADCERLELEKFIPSVLESAAPDRVHGVYRQLFERELTTYPNRYGLVISEAHGFLNGNETAMELASLSLKGHNPIQDAIRLRSEDELNPLFRSLHERGIYDGIISIKDLRRS